jgi:hypothetical protein
MQCLVKKIPHMLLLVALPLQACTADNDPVFEKDAGNKAELSVGVVYPEHIDSMVSPGVRISFTVIGKVDRKVSLDRMKQAISLMKWPSKKSVAATWITEVGGGLQPDAKLTDGDYLLRIKPDGNKLQTDREYTLFHVGSMPRVKDFLFPSQKVSGKSLPPDQITILMSETVDTASIKVTLEHKQGPVFTPLSASQLSGTAFKASQAFDMQSPLRITIDKSLATSSGVKLDGKYTGVAGSGTFVTTFIPKDLASKRWAPDIKF